MSRKLLRFGGRLSAALCTNDESKPQPVHSALTMVALAKHFDELQTTPERLAIPAHAQMQSARMQMPAEISAVTARAV